MQMVYLIEKEKDVDRNELINIAVLKPTSENMTKHWRIRQEMRSIIKIVKVILKQIAI